MNSCWLRASQNKKPSPLCHCSGLYVFLLFQIYLVLVELETSHKIGSACTLLLSPPEFLCTLLGHIQHRRWDPVNDFSWENWGWWWWGVTFKGNAKVSRGERKGSPRTICKGLRCYLGSPTAPNRAPQVLERLRATTSSAGLG